MTNLNEKSIGTVQPESRCGFVALIGAPNAGKSTLLNAAVGGKVSIVSRKVQTTRMRVRGIAVRGDSQIVFVDTPGIFEPKRRLERAMVSAAWTGVEETDIAVLLFDAQRKEPDRNTLTILEGLKARKRNAILVLNKVDLVNREDLLGQAARFEAEGIFDAIFMVSALGGDGVEDLLDDLAARIPSGPWHFPEDQLSDLPQRLLAAEITREKLFERLHQELPYSLTVESEAWEEFRNGEARIQQVIYVERPQHKVICLGKGGERIKQIRELAQAELQ
ncbi:MAG: GTPase Era, partial [Kiloniellales bacterium]|nr:GTPase Era [Kiloniellales bacterium]